MSHTVIDRRGYLDAGAPALPPGTILGPNGQPVSYSQFYEGGNRWRDGDAGRMWFQDAAVDSDELLDLSTYRDILTSARFLFANEPMVRGAVLEQSTLSFPLVHQYRGKDRDWGNRVGEPWLAEWKCAKTVRGPAFTSDICARLRLIGRKVDGDVGTLLTFDGSEEYPRVQYIRGHRISDPPKILGHDGRLTSGKYRGWRCSNGVVLNDRGLPIAYFVTHSDHPEGGDFVPATSMFLTYNPDALDEARGKSELLASIVPFGNIKRLREYEMRAQQMFASIALLEDTESGGPTDSAHRALQHPAAGTDPAGSAAGLIRRTYQKGMTLYYKAMSGAGLKAFRGDRPSRDSQEWEDKMVAAAIYGSGWDPNFAMMLKQPGGALARVMVEKIRRTICLNQQLEARAQRLEDSYALAGAIALKIIPPPSDGDITSWTYQGPARITADSGNEERAKIEKYKMGLLTRQQIVDGDWEQLDAQAFLEAQRRAEAARSLHEMFPEMTFGEWLSFIEDHSKGGGGASAAPANDEDDDPEANPDPKPTRRPQPNEEEED